MAEVLQVPRQPDGQSYYQPSNLRRSPLSSNLFLDRADSPSLSSSPSNRPRTPLVEHHEDLSTSSVPSSVSSSPQPSAIDFSDTATSTSISTASSSGLSLEDKFDGAGDIDFPNYDGGVQFYHQDDGFVYTGESSDDPMESTTTDTTRSDSPLLTPSVADDTAVKQQPSRHVDYLSHNWREEDIWSSWRHIVSQRRVYGQRSRLENASWRTWAKSKYNLRTVSPETLNWLKESDVTWLYGPLKLAQSFPISQQDSAPESQLSKNNSFVSKKPILKKRSMSEVMLQRSISTTTLVKQAAASVQAQQTTQSPRRELGRAPSDYVFTAASSEVSSRSEIDYFTSRSSDSDVATPSDRQEERHIRFDDTVEQCIAVECKEGDFDDEVEEALQTDSADSDSDEGILIMRRKKRPGLSRKTSAKSSRSNSHSDRKTIETLPSTTLKYRTNSPDVTAEAQTQAQQQQHNHIFGRSWGQSKLSPSPSQETLRPTYPSKNFLIRDEESGEVDMESSWSFGAHNAKSSLGASSNVESPSSRGRDNAASLRSRSATPGPAPNQHLDADFDLQSMRRTSSGMLMPYDEDEDEIMAVGLFGRVSETINTAKDIAHVIWNVGWRK